jgi:hypothetical protein
LIFTNTINDKRTSIANEESMRERERERAKSESITKNEREACAVSLVTLTRNIIQVMQNEAREKAE